MSAKKDLTGKTFGVLTVLHEVFPPYAAPGGQSIRRWLVKCRCGKEFATHQTSLLNGAVTSCGCARHSNREKHNLGVRGVTYDKVHGKYLARIKANGINYNLGSYDSLEDAAGARKYAENEIKTHGSLTKNITNRK